MQAERPKAHYMLVFLQVSFRAIKNSMAGKASDSMPCWLDTRMLMMLSRELRECQIASDSEEVEQALAPAIEACDALLERCPGGLDSSHCHRHLATILDALQHAIEALPQQAPAPSSVSRWEYARQQIRAGFQRRL